MTEQPKIDTQKTEATPGLYQDLVKMFADFRVMMKAEFETMRKDMIAEEKENFRKEFVTSIRKASGIDPNAPLTADELPAALLKCMQQNPTLLRKALLSDAETGKKTPAAIEKAGPEGTVNVSNPIDNLMKQYNVGGVKA